MLQTLQFSIDAARCTRCGQRARDCLARVIAQEGDALPRIIREHAQYCIMCQHCLAICPTAALSILGRDPADSLPLTVDSFPTLEAMTRFVRGRRSVRRYQDADIDPALLRQLLATLANAPTGGNRRQLTFTVIDDRAVMRQFQQQVMAGLREAAAAKRIPPRLLYLQRAAGHSFARGAEIIFRGAPHALLVSAPPDAFCPHEDISLTLAYFELLAQSAGLGTCWWGMLKMVLELLPELKTFLDLPADHFYYGILFGLPAVSYARTVQRDDGAVIKTVGVEFN